MAKIYVAEIVAYDSVAASTVTLYFASQGYTTKPTDVPANIHYDGRIQQPANLQRSIFSGAKTSGPSTVSYGELILVNNDGALEDYINYSYDGRPITIKVGEVTRSSTTPVFTTVMVGVMEQVEFSWNKLAIKIRDKQANLNLPLQANKYAGSNVLPNGLEGVAEDLKGKPKPRWYGVCFNVSPPLVNTSRHIYQLSDGLMTSIQAVYDKAAALTPGQARTLTQIQSSRVLNLGFTVDVPTNVATTASASTLETGDFITLSTTGTLPAGLGGGSFWWRKITTTTGTFHPTQADAVAGTNTVDITSTGAGTHSLSDTNTTAAGNFDWCFHASGSYIRLGSASTGQLTVDATQATATAANIMESVLLSAGVSSGEISSADVTALNTANNAQIGYYAGSENEVTFLQVMDEVSNSIGAWFGVNATGTFRMGRIEDPSAKTSVTTLTDLEILEVDRVASQDIGNGIPAWRINLSFKKYYTVQTSDIAGVVTAARKSEVSQEYRKVVVEDATIKVKHLLSPEFNVETLLTQAAAASVEATRLLNLRKVRRDRLECRVKLEAVDLAVIDLGAYVTVELSRFGYSAGKKFVVIGIRSDLRSGFLDLTLWG